MIVQISSFSEVRLAALAGPAFLHDDNELNLMRVAYFSPHHFQLLLFIVTLQR